MMNIEQHYRECIRKYFDDPTEEGEIAKQAAMAECEKILNEYFGYPRSRISEIYDAEYLKKYHPEVMPKEPPLSTGLTMTGKGMSSSSKRKAGMAGIP